jgi:recombination protein RecA
MTTSEDREKALAAAMAQVEKKYGKGSINKLGDAPAQQVQTISTGSLAINLALGVGGLPKGRIIEVYGPESSGKTLLTLHAIAEVQRQGGNAAFIDAEHALDPEWAKKIGVDIDQLVVTQPDDGEQGMDILDTLISSKAFDIIVVDSVAALTPRKELEGDMGDAHVGLQARLMSQGLRKITAEVNKSKTIVIFINQLREKIGGLSFGPSETTTGGKALKFYASVRIDIRRIGALKEGTDIIGARTKVKIAKNKVAPPFKVAEFDLVYGGKRPGFSREGDIIDMGAEEGFIKKSGSWYTYDGGKQLGQGKEKARAFLSDNPDVANAIEAQILEARLPKPAETAPAVADAEDLDD